MGKHTFRCQTCSGEITNPEIHAYLKDVVEDDMKKRRDSKWPMLPKAIRDFIRSFPKADVPDDVLVHIARPTEYRDPAELVPGMAYCSSECKAWNSDRKWRAARTVEHYFPNANPLTTLLHDRDVA